MADFTYCPKCGGVEWKGIPDSLAEYCVECGSVRVEKDGGYVEGASIQQWAADLAEAKKPKELVRVEIVVLDNESTTCKIECGKGQKFTQVYLGMVLALEELQRQIVERSKCPFAPKEDKK